MDDPARQRVTAVAAAVLVLLPLCASLRYNQTQSWDWFLRAGLAALLYLFLLCRVCRLPAQGWLRAGSAMLLAEVLALFLGLRLVSFFFQGESFNARFFFHLTPDSLTDAGSYPLLIAGTLVYLLLVPLLVWTSVRQLGPRRTPPLRMGLALLVLLLLEPDLASMLRQGIQASQERRETLASLDVAGTGLHLEAIEPHLDGITAGKNLVLVYMESLEKVYTEETLFPGLTPFLSSLKQDSLYFSDLRSSEGATWTVAGMMASQCGTPLLTSIGPRGNDILQNGFLHEATCLGDLLGAAGYHQAYVGGASTRFAGKGTFLSQHGYEEVLGLDELLPRLPNPDYLNNWGLYDDSTLGFAAAKFDELASDPKQPFNLTVLTVDTHHPAGTPSASCPRYPGIDNTILHAVHCSDWLLQRFVAHLQQQPAWANTVLVLMSDHLAMRNIAQHLYPSSYERELFFAVINAGESREVSLPASHMDVAPTLLPLLQVGHEQQFLAGDNLLDPATEARVVDFAAPRRISAIRFINNELLTRKHRNICAYAGPMLAIRKNRLLLAGEDTYLGLGGRPIPLEMLAAEHGFVALLEADGTVQSTMVFNAHNLPFFLHQTGDLSYLVLGSAATLAPMLPGQLLAAGVNVVAGNRKTGNRALLLGAQLDQLEVDVGCGDLPGLNQSTGSATATAGVSDATALAALCPVPPDAAGVVMDEASDRIDAVKVAVANQWYNASLQGDGEGAYRIVALNLLGPITDEPPKDYCHAYYGRGKVLLPYVQAGDHAFSMQMDLLPGTNDQFHLSSLHRL